MEDNELLGSVPDYIKRAMDKSELEIALQAVIDAGLIKEFEEFVNNGEFGYMDEYFSEFGKLYPDKFYIVPEDKRYSKTFFVEGSKRERIPLDLDLQCQNPKCRGGKWE